MPAKSSRHSDQKLQSQNQNNPHQSQPVTLIKNHIVVMDPLHNNNNKHDQRKSPSPSILRALFLGINSKSPPRSPDPTFWAITAPPSTKCASPSPTWASSSSFETSGSQSPLGTRYWKNRYPPPPPVSRDHGLSSIPNGTSPPQRK